VTTEDLKGKKTTLSINLATKRRVRVLAALFGIKPSTVLENAVTQYARANASEFLETLGLDPKPVEPPANWRRTA
jgi:hypothetical protein